MIINRQKPNKTELMKMAHDELADWLLSTQARVRELEKAIEEALAPGRYGWELLDADTMAERLVDAHDPFDQGEPGLSEYEQVAQQERAALEAWNTGKPIQGMRPPGYYVINP